MWYFLNKIMNIKAPLDWIHHEINQKQSILDFEINRIYERCICHYCNSLAIKQMLLPGLTLYFLCDKCAKNITRSKMQICDDPECFFPSIKNSFAELDLTLIDNYHFCQVCNRYLWHLKFGFITHFSSMDFSLSSWEVIQFGNDSTSVDERAIVVHKYLKK